MKKTKRPRLSRGWRAICNLGLTAVMAILCWGFLGFPIPDARLDFRRTERANWVVPSKIQGSFELLAARGDERLRWTVATGEEWVLLHQNVEGYPYLGERIDYWPRESGGPTLVPLPLEWVGMGEAWIAAVDVPEGTASAVLELTTACYYREKDENSVSFHREGTAGAKEAQRWEKTYVLEGELLEEGGILFHLAPEEDRFLERAIINDVYDWEKYLYGKNLRSVDCAMEAVFNDEAGRELGRAELRMPD